MARTITAGTSNRWWTALDVRTQFEGGAKEWSRGVGLSLSLANAFMALETCALPTSFGYDGLYPDGQPIKRVTALGDTVLLEKFGEGEDEFVEDLIRNFVALTNIEPENVDETVPINDIEPMIKRLREARETRDE